MGSEWKETTLGNIAAKGGHGLVDGPFGSNLPASSYMADGIPVIRGSNLTLGSGRFKGDEFVYVSGETADRLSRSLCKANDIVFTKKGTLGQTGLVPDDGYESYLISSNQMKLTVDTDVALPLYVYYFVSSQQSTEKIIRDSESTGVPKTNLAYLKDFPISLPPLEKQKRIAHVLGSLDNKIALNRQINTTLESMAQTLFKSWFVDFDPVIDNALAAGNDIPEPLQARAEKRAGLHQNAAAYPALPDEIKQLFPDSFVFTEDMGWVPEGWEVGKLGDFVDVKRGGSPRPIHDFLVEEGLPWVKISDATSDSSRFLMETKQFIKPEGLKKTVMLKAGELILSNSATPGLPKFLNLDACIHDGWLYFPKKQRFTDSYLYQLFLVVKDKLLAQGNGSVFTNLKTDILKSLPVAVPPVDLIEHVTELLRSLHERSLCVQSEIETLSNLRDSLLPKLLSGQLSTPEAEQALDKVN